MSINWQLDGEPRPTILVVPPAAVSLDEAHAAIELWEHYSHKTLDPAQVLAVEVMMAQAADGTWAAGTTGREMPRQNGKGDEVEVVELWGLVQRAEAIMHTVHDAVLLASQTQQRMLAVLEGHADLRRLVKRRWLGTGQQMIEMRNGGIIWYRTRTGGGGRGVDDIDRLVVDEAQHAAEEHLAALTPTLFANPNPQTNVLGTAGIEGKSDWWWGVRIRALGYDPSGFGYVGHTAETVRLDESGRVVQTPVDVEDRSLWPLANPALVAQRGQGMKFFEEQLRRLGRHSFGREHLGIWDPPPVPAGQGVVPLEAWQACEDPLSGPVGRVAFALDVSVDRRSASFGVVGESGRGGTHGEIADYIAMTEPLGTAQLVARAKDLQNRWQARLAIATGSPAASLLEELKQAGVDVTMLTTGEHAAACGALFDEIIQRRFKHLGQHELNAAVSGADRRFYGDSWLWSRRTSVADISPLVAVTLAKWAFDQGPAFSDPALSVW